jgi:hypothetical protein
MRIQSIRRCSGCRSWGCLSLAEWVDGLGECDDQRVEVVACGDAVLGLESRKPLVSGQGIRIIPINEVGEHEVTTLAAAAQAKGHQISHEGVAGVLRAAGV